MEVLGHGQEIVRMYRIGDVSKLMLGGDRFLFDIMSADTNCAGCRAEDAGNRPQRGRLAGSVSANQPYNLPCSDRKAEVPNCREVGIAFGELLKLNNGFGVF